MRNDTVTITHIPMASGGVHAAGAEPAQTTAHMPVFSRYVVFSATLFLIIFIAGGAAFYFSMREIIRESKSNELTKLLQVERIRLEALVNKEIAIVLKMAGSPLIRNHFENPADAETARMAKKEIEAYRQSLTAGTSIFWINDIDKLFHIDETPPFLLDATLPENYWYPMTINETDSYNFNINFNPDLNVTNLWVNAPVFNRERQVVGILGVGVNLSTFVNAVYNSYHGKASLHLFNAAGEITGAKDVDIVAEKKNIVDELGDLGANAFLRSKLLQRDEVQTIPTQSGEAAVIAVSMLEWFAVAVYPDSWEDFNTPMTVIFGLGILAIAFILILSNIFIAGLLVPLRRTMHFLKEATDTANAEREEVLEGIRYASQIQRHLLPNEAAFRDAFEDYSIIWKPRDIVGGDIYWIKNFNEGTVLCVCDCTGHGTPGALLTMLVVSAFETIVGTDHCKDPAKIIWGLEQRLVTVLGIEPDGYQTNPTGINDGCDLAVLFIAKNGDVAISAGRTNVFVCNGEKTERIKGQKIFVGEGKLESADDIETVHIPYHPENKFYIASDGLFDQPGGTQSGPFGYKAFEQLVLQRHHDKQSVISERIWGAFERHRGEEMRVDDFELITFKPSRKDGNVDYDCYRNIKN